MAEPQKFARPGRLHALDAIRGLAALSVLAYHALLTVPDLDTTSLRGADASAWQWMLAHSPLRVFWAGGAAVTLFFVLSGLVLTVAVNRAQERRWPEYYVRRVLRLYLPVVGAVVLSSFWITLVPRIANEEFSRWMSNVGQPTVLGVLKDLSIFWEPGSTTSVLWSLTWELAFSLLLPAYLWLVNRSARWAAPGVAAAIGLSVIGDWLGSNVLRYLPVFAVGCYVAVLPSQALDMARWVWERGHTRRRLVTAMVLAQMFTLAFLLPGLGLVEPIWVGIGWTSLLLSCGAIVAIGFVADNGEQSWRSDSLQWLGSRSFSLYLVHEPIVVSTAIVGSGVFSEWWVLPLSLPISLIVAEVFFRVVERPAVSLIRRISVPAITSSRFSLARPPNA